MDNSVGACSGKEARLDKCAERRWGGKGRGGDRQSRADAAERAIETRVRQESSRVCRDAKDFR